MEQESRLSVLLIEDDPDTARMVQWVLSAGGGAPMGVDWASDLNGGIERIERSDYQAILLDLNLPDSCGFDTFARVRQKAPDRAIIVLTGQEDQALAMQMLRGGADEYLVKSEIRDRFLPQRIRFAVERSRMRDKTSDNKVKNGKIFTFTGAKGGSGTTTTLLNFGATIAQLGKTVIAIDLVPDCGGIPVLLNRSPSRDISMLLRGGPEMISRDVVASCLDELSPGFHALCGPVRWENRRPITAELTRPLLAVARGMADYILVDLPSAGASGIAEEVVQQSNLTILVAEGSPIGLHAAMARAPSLFAVARPGSLGAVLVNKTPGIDFSPSEFSMRLGCRVIGVIPSAGESLAAEQSTGLPVLQDPRAAFSSSLSELAQRLASGALGVISSQ
ncbi:MAG TPA: response regulator [Bryobacteraceae bacterium]|nr:response regulator [Bryobacteraceae bacterium]